jgi:hypothetical protein
MSGAEHRRGDHRSSPAPIHDGRAVASRYSLHLGRPARRVRICSLNAIMGAPTMTHSQRPWPHCRPLGTARPRDAPVKPRHRNWPPEADVQMRAVISDFVNSATGPQIPACAGISRKTGKRCKNSDLLAGAPGFEPGNGGIKIRLVCMIYQGPFRKIAEIGPLTRQEVSSHFGMPRPSGTRVLPRGERN